MADIINIMDDGLRANLFPIMLDYGIYPVKVKEPYFGKKKNGQNS